MAAPSPSTKPSRRRSNGREASRGVLVAGRERRQQIESGHSKRMNHAVSSAGEHHIGIAASNDLGRLANGLTAGGAGGEAVEVRTLSVEHGRQVAGRHVGLLLQLARRIQRLQAALEKARDVKRAPLQARHHHASERIEVGVSFAASQIDAEPGPIRQRVQHSGRVARPVAPHRRRSAYAGPAAPTPRGLRRSAKCPSS